MSDPDKLRQRVRRRAKEACEYCRLPESASALAHQVDHIIAVQHAGSDDESNLCLCCIRCNLKKGPNIASVDPAASEQPSIVPLYHPRQDRWEDHFRLLEDGTMRGLTPKGRATVRLLEFNATERVVLRVMLMRRGWRP
jgi:5-methylcytosine-specific restriction endonuclease McrA